MPPAARRLPELVTSGLTGVPAGMVAVLVAVLLAGCAQATHEAAWPDLVTARQQGAIERGWIPAFLPEATRDIRQRNEPATGARIAVARLPADVAIPECEGPSDAAPALDAEWFPAMRGEPVACEDGWTIARTDDTIALWHVGDLEVVS